MDYRIFDVRTDVKAMTEFLRKCLPNIFDHSTLSVSLFFYSNCTAVSTSTICTDQHSYFWWSCCLHQIAQPPCEWKWSKQLHDLLQVDTVGVGPSQAHPVFPMDFGTLPMWSYCTHFAHVILLHPFCMFNPEELSQHLVRSLYTMFVNKTTVNLHLHKSLLALTV